MISKNVIKTGTKGKNKGRLSININNNNLAMPEVETIEGYILNAYTKFEVNRLNGTQDFMSTRLKKVISRTTRLKF